MGSTKKAFEKLREAESSHRDYLASMANFNIEPVCSAEAIAIKKWLRDRSDQLGLGLEHKYRVKRAPDFPPGIIGFPVDFFRKRLFMTLSPDLLPDELESPQICIVKLDQFGTDGNGFAVFPPVPKGEKVVVTNLTDSHKYFGMRMGVDSDDFPAVPNSLDAKAQITLTASQCLRVLLRSTDGCGSWGAFAKQAFKAD